MNHSTITDQKKDLQQIYLDPQKHLGYYVQKKQNPLDRQRTIYHKNQKTQFQSFNNCDIRDISNCKNTEQVKKTQNINNYLQNTQKSRSYTANDYQQRQQKKQLQFGPEQEFSDIELSKTKYKAGLQKLQEEYRQNAKKQLKKQQQIYIKKQKDFHTQMQALESEFLTDKIIHMPYLLEFKKTNLHPCFEFISHRPNSEQNKKVKNKVDIPHQRISREEFQLLLPYSQNNNNNNNISQAQTSKNSNGKYSSLNNTCTSHSKNNEFFLSQNTSPTAQKFSSKLSEKAKNEISFTQARKELAKQIGKPKGLKPIINIDLKENLQLYLRNSKTPHKTKIINSIKYVLDKPKQPQPIKNPNPFFENNSKSIFKKKYADESLVCTKQYFQQEEEELKMLNIYNFIDSQIQKNNITSIVDPFKLEDISQKLLKLYKEDCRNIFNHHQQ